MGLRGPKPTEGVTIAEFKICRPKKPRLTAVASEHWDEIIPILEGAKLLNESHGTVLAFMCESYADWQRYNEIVADKVPTMKGAKGVLMIHPVERLMRRAREDYIKCAEMFGMTPRTMGRVFANQESVQNLVKEREASIINDNDED